MKAKNLNLQPNALLAELVGTFILATVAITVANPIIVGFTLVVLVLAIGGISGAHVNPAVTFGLWSVKKIEGIKVPFYWAMQLAGALLALLVSQFYQGGSYGISFASFGSFDGKIFLAELLGTAVFTFAVAAAVLRKELDSAKAFAIGLALLTGLAVGGGLLGQAVQNISASGAKETPRVAKIDGAILNPAIALAATEKAEQQTASLQSLNGEQEAPKTPASRLTWETLLGALVGGALGMNLLMVLAGEGVNPLNRKDTSVAAKVTTVIKKGKKEVKKATKKAKK
jgi:glycerol uptake facilitator-like aquaporin